MNLDRCDLPKMEESDPDNYSMEFIDGQTIRSPVVSSFNAAIDLFQIMERIIKQPFIQPDRASTMRAVNQLQNDLDNFHTNMDPLVQLPEKGRLLQCTAMITAWWWAATILLHRPFIPTSISLTLAPSKPYRNDHHQKASEAANALTDLLLRFVELNEISKLPPNDSYLIFSAATMVSYAHVRPIISTHLIIL
jgi:hypothetical protein